jgi:hypothetical protein
VGGHAWAEDERYARQAADESRRKIEDKLRESSQEVARLQAALQKYQDATGTTEPPATPDSHNYEILEHQQVGSHMVLKVRYPNCIQCAYEGVKVLVYEHVSVGDMLYWRVIDPHFSDPERQRPKKEAPPPSARFPGNETGWGDAVAYATDVLGHRYTRRDGKKHEAHIEMCMQAIVPPGQKLAWACVRPKGHPGDHMTSEKHAWKAPEPTATKPLCTATTEVSTKGTLGTVHTCNLPQGHRSDHLSPQGHLWPNWEQSP